MDKERYSIIKLLGKGRTGGVYEAMDSNLDRKVALRRFFAQTKDTKLDEYKTDFEKVAQSLSALQHPNLLRVYDAGVDSDGAYIISQLLQGEILNDHVIQNGPMPYWVVHDLAQQMLDALSSSHEAGFVHGAITPGSIILSPRARGGFLYVILDMGLSRLAPLIQGKDSILSIMADPAILAPELFNGGNATERADLYMLGHILYMALAGGHPFAGVPAIEAEKMHQEGLPPIQQYAQDVPEDFRIWLEKLTQFDPDERPASAVEALGLLPKVIRPATDQTRVVQGITGQLNSGTAIQTQSPTGSLAEQTLPGHNAAITTGVSASAPAALAGAGVLRLPKAKKDYKKLIFIGLGLVVALVVIGITTVFYNMNSEKQKLATMPAESTNGAEAELPNYKASAEEVSGDEITSNVNTKSNDSVNTKPKVVEPKVVKPAVVKPAGTSTIFPEVSELALLVDFNEAENRSTQANFIGVNRNTTTIKTSLAANGSSISLSFDFYGTAVHKRDRYRSKLDAKLPQSDLLRDFVFGDKTSTKGSSGLTITLGSLAAGDYTFTGFHHDRDHGHGLGTIKINGGAASTLTASTGGNPKAIGMSKVNFTSDGVSNVVIFIDNKTKPAVINGFIIVPVP